MQKIKHVWRKEARRRAATQFRRERINLNWPIHAERIALVFSAFKVLAEGDDVHMNVIVPNWLKPIDERHSYLEERLIGSSALILEFGLQRTGEGVINISEAGTSFKIDCELGAKLVIQHSEADAFIQVFFESPREVDEERPEPLLFAHTHNTDDVTYDWVVNLISSFLVFNRFESRLQDYKLIDSWRVRWWRFRDIRNRRGYLDKFQHIFTPWELVLVAAIAAIPVLALAKLFIG